MYPVTSYMGLKCLVITGNPFAIAADQHFTTRKLEAALDKKGGELINESLNPPQFIRSRAGTSSTYTNTGFSRGKIGGATSGIGSDSTRPATFHNNYNYNALVQVKQDKPRTTTHGDLGQISPPGMAWARAGNILEGKPLAIDYNPVVM